MNRRLTLVLALLAAASAAAPAAGQDAPPGRPAPGNQGGRGDKGRDPVEFGDPPAPAEEPEKEPPVPESGRRTEPQILVEQLSRWPSSEAKQASIVLAAQPTVSFPLLKERMLDPDIDWRAVAGVAATLGKIGDARGIELIEAKLQDRRMYLHSATLLDALVRIDPVGAKARLRAALLHPASAVVKEAADRLESRVSLADAPHLRDIIEAGGTSARAAATRLLARADPEGARADLVSLLRDPSSEVGFEAALAVSRDNSPECIAMLGQATASAVDRQLAYAMLSLAAIAERTGDLVADEAVIRTALGGRGVKSLNRLNRACAAILLADIGYFHQVKVVDDALETTVVPALVDTWVGTEYWADMKTIRPVALRRLERISGRYGVERPEEWVNWWERVRNDFRARRILREVTPDTVSSFVLEVSGHDAPGSETTRLTAAPDLLSAAVEGEAPVLLVEADALELGRVVNESGLLDSTTDEKNSQDDGPLVFRISAASRSRRVTMRAATAEKGVQALLAHVTDLRTRYGWQRYRPFGSTMNVEEFVETMAPAFALERPQTDRRRALARLVVGSIDPSSQTQGVRALEDLRGWEDLPEVLADAEVDALLKILGRQEGFSPVGELCLDVLGRCGRPEALEAMLDFLATRPSPRTHELTVRVLGSATPLQLGDALTSERAELRVAAQAALREGALSGAEIAAARRGVEDPHPLVRAEAVRALGRLRSEDSRAELERLAMEPGDLRMAAVEALGLLGGKASLPVIMTAYASNDPALRVAAIDAFAKAGEPEGLSAIVFAMSGDPSPLVREVAGRAIRSLGNDRAAGALRLLVIDPGQPEGPRATAVKGLALLRGSSASPDLVRLLRDPAAEVADEAALALARWREAEAFDRLLDMLKNGRRPSQARQALESLSLERFDQDDPAMLMALYSGWWDLAKETGRRAWLRDALRQRGILDAGLDAYAEGRITREAVPVLLETLGSDEWYLRRAANLALEEILARKVGDQEPWTTPGEAARMAREWERVWTEMLGR